MPEYRDLIDNPRSERIRHLADLKERCQRLKYGRFLIEGPQSVREAVRYRPELLLDLYVAVSAGQGIEPTSPAVAQIRNQALAQAPQAYVHYVSERTMQAISKDAQGIAAVGRLEDMSVNPAQILPLEEPSGQQRSARGGLAALWQVRDPGNAGTIIRTADAAGCAGVVLVDECVDPFNPKVLRATAGSIFHIPVIQLSTQAFFSFCQERRLPVVAADVYGSPQRPPQSLPDFVAALEPQSPPPAVLFGNEARGLPVQVLNQTSAAVSIPIYGQAESLNLATSAAVLLYALAMSSRLGRM
ncbi:rRNA methyltransferase [Bombiscardovia nodaiensis]|uniref:rRNA methyltransferase n=1 Tax=Bombiscardovia nodaiensis TaxID=2932181 RepID=A0ABN6SC41_9BIFI|nr:rRNA methyltransferase [Bombiscardovia nodaiensis]